MLQTRYPASSPAARPAPWRIWLRTARPFSLSAAISPVLVGTAVAAYGDRTFTPLTFAATLLASVFLQVGTNFFNEYFDHRYGLDTDQSLGASTVIFRGEMTPAQVLGGGVGSFAVAAALGLFLIFAVGPQILLFGLAAMTIGYFYSARPFKFASRGLGDPLVYLAMGFLMTWGAYYVQVHAWSWQAFAASVPVGLLVVAILNMNNLRDYPDDLAVHKRTVVVRFGLPFGRRYQAALVLGAYVTTTVFAVVGLLPLASLAVWLTLPLGLGIARIALTATDRKQFIPGMKRISLLHLAFGVVLAAAITVAALVG